MPSHSSRSVRASGIPNSVSREEFLEAGEKISAEQAKKKKFFGFPKNSAAAVDQDVVISLAPQFGEQFGTMTFPLKEDKERILKENAKWTYDDLFDGITVLHSTSSPIFDICAIHGLNGNAFDTWSTGDVMWLRDLLPRSPQFEDTRIMTFGYNSQWADKKSLSGLQEWSNDLLDRICSVRTTEEEQKRPIIFICHSLGGLVARQAMIRLNAYSHLFPGIQLEQCAIMFLATPHLGSDQADWNKYLIDLAELIGGIRADAIVNPLRSFNPLSTEANEDFRNMKVKVPYECYYETELTKVAGMNRHPNGMPPIDARHYPLPANRKWYEGKGLRTTDQLKVLRGRRQELNTLGDLFATFRQDKSSSIAVTGIGGIGKTEMLLEVAYQRLNQTNIFFLRASDKASLDDAYFHIARRLGHDILLENDRGKPTLDIWNNMSRDEKIEKFRIWLKQPENAQTLFILDDLDGLKESELILSAMPHEAKTILFSTRNSVLLEGLDRRTHHVRLSSMDSHEVVQLMESVLERTGYEADGDILDRGTLSEIADALHGHPLASILAIRYITRVIAQEGLESPEKHFLNILKGSDFESRRNFLEYKAGGPSIIDTFSVSRNRLQEKNGKAWKLMQYVAVLETDDSIVDFRKFFYNRSDKIDPKMFPDNDILVAKSTEISEAFAEFETVSFGERVRRNKPIQFHPLWLECTLHAMGAEGRIQHIRHVLMVCYLSASGAPESITAVFLPHVKRCKQVCESFRIQLAELLQMDALNWVIEL